MRFQRGQSIMEFALVLPLFLLFTFAIIYFGCVFADYVTLGTIARSSARAAAVLQQEDAAKQQQDYKTIRDGFHDQKLPFDIYEWNPGDMDDFDIQHKPPTTSAPNGNVEVTVNAKLQGFGKDLVRIVNGLSDSKIDGNLSITYTMYSEYNWSKK
ncbi:TadE family protein [uncultured Mitsuokella sp.]|uniref:TadE family protein n=2 Tax=Mitsuokella TaxID=52225 RepID=UPI002593E78F|nr:TadE family protein [uncultured Mitsuokella sp.]